MQPQPTPPTSILGSISSRKRRISTDAEILAEYLGMNKRRKMPKGSSMPAQLPTPPTAGSPPQWRPTMNLRITIPQPAEPDDHQKRVLAAQKGAAKRWQSKLSNPYPKDAEIRKAYHLKLMRHYTGPPTAPVTNLKPIAQKSERITRLLKQFPALSIPKPQLQTPEAQRVNDEAEFHLRKNRAITESSHAVQFATKNFATTEICNKTATRQALRESGLLSEELRKEERGLKNALPEWKKWRTGEYAQRKREEARARKAEMEKRTKLKLKLKLGPKPVS
ncbi:hypothetical protein BDV96DRAFT_646095 [Lophiotrema nucula]|uniref:Uncharacterized protein n=1 Tax=Lophiotrema nucula TaxID=690887 RepID=A0A6A5Z8Z7_9PLEO|nr:hypothetical protein BDV96DRAFT_646095 [Lophiotrema nucula]